MDNATATHSIVNALTKAIVEHRLHPGTKLAEQKLAEHFGVSRTLIRQALFQLVQKRLIRMEPARGAFVATPSVDEARQVFSVRRMMAVEMTRHFVRDATPAQIKTLKDHLAEEKAALARGDIASCIHLLGEFHVRMAELMNNDVLAQILSELISRCALITPIDQSGSKVERCVAEHAEILKAIAAKDEKLATKLMSEHLDHLEIKP